MIWLREESTSFRVLPKVSSNLWMNPESGIYTAHDFGKVVFTRNTLLPEMVTIKWLDIYQLNLSGMPSHALTLEAETPGATISEMTSTHTSSGLLSLNLSDRLPIYGRVKSLTLHDISVVYSYSLSS